MAKAARHPLAACVVAAALVTPTTPVLAEGSRDLYPASYPAGGFRSTMDLRAAADQRYMGVISGRQFLYVYAEAGEYILAGSRNRNNGGDVLIYDPQAFGTKADETRPATANFQCSSSTPPAGSYSGTGLGLIADRAQELAGPNSADNSTAVAGGFAPCAYRAPATGIYGVQFTGATSGGSGTPNGSVATPQILTNQVSAWDVTVRGSATSTNDLKGRLFSYAWVAYTGSNPRPVHYTLHYVTGDGYRYRQILRGVDPNRAAFYANSRGFLDAGAPLYKDVRGNSDQVGTGAFPPGVTPQQPEYPLFFADVDSAGPNAGELAKTLGALGIPLVPPPPQLTNPTFVGNIGGIQSTVSAGGVFQFDVVDTLTYEVVISADGLDYDPANPLNRVLTGTALTGNHRVLWDGLRNDGTPFPAGNYRFRIAGRNGEIHFPMLDIEGNVNGGPTLTKLNGSGGSTVYFDDRGYRTRGGTLVGELNGRLCGATNAQVPPSPNHSLLGVDSSVADGSGRYYRWWTATGNVGGSNACRNAADEAFGNWKGLDAWTLERSPEIEQPLEIVPGSTLVDVGVQLVVDGSAYPGDTVRGSLVYIHAGDVNTADATGVAYTLRIGTPGSCPAGVDFTLLPSGAAFTYDSATCAVTFTGLPATLSPGDSLSFNFEYTAPATGPVPTEAAIDSVEDPLANAPNPPDQPVPNRASASTGVVVADAATTVTVPGTAAPGSTVSGSVTFENLGSATATAQGVTYTLVIGTPGSCPADVTFQNLPPGVTATYDSDTCAVVFTGMPTSLAPGDSVAIDFTYTAPASGVVPVHSGISTDTPESDTDNNVADDETNFTLPADVGIVKTGPVSVPINAPIAFVLTLTNAGPGAADGTSFSDMVPAGISSITASCGPVSGGAVCNDADLVVAGSAVSGTIATLPNGGMAQVLIQGVAPPTAGPMSNIAYVYPPSGIDDPNPGNDNSMVDTYIDPLADMEATIDLPPDAIAGEPVDGSFSCTNNGPSAAENATCTIAGLPADAVVTCTPTPPVVSLAPGDTIACTVRFIAPGDGPVTGTATAGSDTPDPDPANNSAVDTLAIEAAADIAVTKSVDDDTPNVGQTVTFTVIATNNGPSPATNVVISDGLPAGLALVAATPDQGAYDPASGNWTIPGPLANGASATLTIQAQVTAPGSLVNTAVRTGGDQVDPVSSNNSGSAPVNSAPSADLQVEKTVDDATPDVNSNVTFTIRVHNAGPNDATGVVIGDVLPSGLVWVSSAPSQGTYDQASGQWTIGNLANGATATLDIVATVTTTDPLVNTATVVGSDQFDPNESNNEDGVAVNGQAADIQVVKTADNANATLGDPVTYTITVTNNGPSAATGVTVTDQLPAGLDFVTATASQGSYDEATGLWTIGDLDASGSGATATLTIRATVTTLGRIVNVATSNGGDQPDPVGANNSDEVPINGVELPAPTAQKSFDPASVPVGSATQMTITLANPNAIALTGVGFTDAYPAGLVNGEAPVLVANTCGGTVVADPGAGSLALSGGTLPASASCAITVTVVGTAEGSLVNTTGPIGSDNALPGAPATGTLIATPSADVSIVKTGPASVQAGAPITWVLTIANAGPSAAGGASFSDAVPAGVTGVAAACGTTTGGAVCNDADLAVAGNAVSGTIATLPNGASVEILVTGTAPTEPTTLQNGAHVDPPVGTNDPNEDDNDSDTIGTIVGAAADLAVAKTGTASVLPGGNAVYTIVVENRGPSAASNVVLSDPTPAGLVFAAADAPCAAGFPCALGTLASGGSVTITVTYQVPLGYTGANPIVNTASVGSDTPDPDPANDSASANTAVGTSAADLVIRKTASAATVAPGGTLTWTITVRNDGPNDATGVRVTDVLPAGVASATTSGCAEDPAGVPTCTLGTIATGSSVIYTIQATIAADASGTLANRASVAGNETDPDPSNNEDGVDVAVIPVVADAADLSIAKRALGTAVPGQTLVYEVVVRNKGPAAAQNVIAHDALPGSLAFVETAGCLNDPTGVPDCQLGTVQAGAQVSYRITTRVAADASGSIVNRATVDSQTPDPNPEDNASSFDTPVGGNSQAHPVPTTSEWALLLLMLMVGGGVASEMRRRERKR